MYRLDIGKDKPARLALCFLAIAALASGAFFSSRQHFFDRQFAENLVKSAFCTADTSDSEIYKYREIYNALTEQ